MELERDRKQAYPGLDFEVKGHIAYLTFHDPRTLNAISYPAMGALNELLELLKKDRSVYGVILTGEGRSFIAGADLSNEDSFRFSYFRPEEQRDRCLYIHDTFQRLARFERPTLAAINGFALGGGAELALCCDIRIASTKAKVGFPEVGLGAVPCYTGPSRAVKLLGVSVAKEMILSGRHYTAAEAMQRGFVSQVVEPEELLTTAESIMGQIVSRAPIAVMMGKLLCDKAVEMSLDASLEYERLVFSTVQGSRDYEEGMAAFQEKRTAEFKNM